MNLELTSIERDILLETLNERLGELREQVYHATTSTFKDELKERERTLKRLIAKCEAVKVA